ncbi:MAG: hypothetical protein ABIC95_03695 [archaeon]
MTTLRNAYESFRAYAAPVGLSFIVSSCGDEPAPGIKYEVSFRDAPTSSIPGA